VGVFQELVDSVFEAIEGRAQDGVGGRGGWEQGGDAWSEHACLQAGAEEGDAPPRSIMGQVDARVVALLLRRTRGTNELNRARYGSVAGQVARNSARSAAQSGGGPSGNRTQDQPIMSREL
jgi:hypothetical protein